MDKPRNPNQSRNASDLPDLPAIPGGVGGLIRTGQWPNVTGSTGGVPAKPFAREIFLIATHVAGTMYVDGIEMVLQSLEVGTRLYFFREPDNPTDQLAVMIRDSHGRKLGYVPKKNNEVIARLMDAGKLIYAVLEEHEEVGEWAKLTIQIYMND
jgi:hypothetical protein